MSEISGALLETSSVNSNLSNNSNITGSINDTKITGNVSSTININGLLSNNNNLNSNIQSNSNISAKLSVGGSGSYLDYSGSYDIIPNQQDQTLQTQNKILRENMLVEKIPYYETSNDYGKTVYIGSEVQINGN